MGRILIVDDRAEIRLVLSLLLENHGHVVFEAMDGAEVVSLSQQHQPDLILLDLMMPGVDGFEALRQLREHPVVSAVPVIVMTAAPTPEGRQLALDLGASDYIAKPFGASELVACVNASFSGAPAATLSNRE